jgi:hypothetical protein
MIGTTAIRKRPPLAGQSGPRACPTARPFSHPQAPGLYGSGSMALWIVPFAWQNVIEGPIQLPCGGAGLSQTRCHYVQQATVLASRNRSIFQATLSKPPQRVRARARGLVRRYNAHHESKHETFGDYFDEVT